MIPKKYNFVGLQIANSITFFTMQISPLISKLKTPFSEGF